MPRVLEATKFLAAPIFLHCHDWQTALIPILLKTLYDEDPVSSGAVCIHHPQPWVPGPVSAGDICRCCCCPGTCSPCRKLEFYGKVNFPERRHHLCRFHYHCQP